MKKSGFIALAALLIITAVSSAYGGISFGGKEIPRREPSSGAGNISKKAEEAFLKGDYNEVVNLGNEYLARGTRKNDELQYLMGRALLKLGRIDEARNRFLRVVNDSKTDELLDKAYTGLADSYYLEGDYKNAKEHYEKVMRYFPDTDDMPVLYYRLGQCQSKLGDNAASKEYYSKLTGLYPDSFEAKLLIGEKPKFVTYSVQAGSFKSWKNANNLCNELKREGFDASISAAIIGNGRFYRVRVGNYNQLSEAEDMARALRNRGYAVKICP